MAVEMMNANVWAETLEWSSRLLLLLLLLWKMKPQRTLLLFTWPTVLLV